MMASFKLLVQYSLAARSVVLKVKMAFGQSHSKDCLTVQKEIFCTESTIIILNDLFT